VRTPLFVSTSALGLNSLLSYLLIFGKLGFPRLGVEGAALAALISRILECGALLWLTYRRRLPAAGTLGELFHIDRAFAARVLKPVLPVVLNETLWSLGITTYYAVYARMGTDSLAAMNIAGSIDNIALVLFLGIAHACAVLVGNRIGAGQEEEAHRYGVRSLSLGIAAAVLIGGAILLVSPTIVTFYKVSPAVIQHARDILLIVALSLWLRTSNLILFLGLLRAGGDTRYALVLDAGIIWAVGVPLAFLGGIVLKFPIHLVYLMVLTEEFCKWMLAMSRLGSRRWIHNLAKDIPI
jgi:putative MATE family efflux protein